MSRIEQEPNGTYVKKVDELLQQVIDRLYKEVMDRRNEDDRIRVTLQEVVDFLEAKKIMLNELQVAVEDNKLAMRDFVQTAAFELLSNRYNAHAGNGGGAHALATNTEHGFMSATDKAYLDELPDKVETKELKVEGKAELNNLSLYGMDVHVLRLVSTGLDSPRVGETACYYDGKLVRTSGYLRDSRGYHLVIIDRATGKIDKFTAYDTHEDTTTTVATDELTRLIADLQAIDHTKIIGIWTYDQASIENASVTHSPTNVAAFQEQIFRFGGSDAVVNMQYRSAYSLIGIADIGKGNGIEQMGYPHPVETSTLIVGGNPMGMSI